MILLSTLPKNSLGIIKLLEIEDSLKTELASLGIGLGTKIRVKNLLKDAIIFDAYLNNTKKRITIPIKEALKIQVLPI